MGVATLRALQAGLLEALPADTPVAVVQHASLPQQRHAVSTLGDAGRSGRREAWAARR